MKNLNKFLLGFILLWIISCAAKPSSIQPAAVSKLPYVNLSCTALEIQMEREADTLEALTGDQVTQRNWDIALNIILLPGLGAATGDSEELIAQSKGKLVVMQDEFISRCSEKS